MAKAGKKKYIRYRRPLNIGVVFFGFIAVYLIVCIYMYFTQALRTEQVYTADKAGYINYYASENEKVSVLSTVYTIDESGRMADILQENADDISLTEENFTELRTQIST